MEVAGSHYRYEKWPDLTMKSRRISLLEPALQGAGAPERFLARKSVASHLASAVADGIAPQRGCQGLGGLGLAAAAATSPPPPSACDVVFASRSRSAWVAARRPRTCGGCTATSPRPPRCVAPLRGAELEIANISILE